LNDFIVYLKNTPEIHTKQCLGGSGRIMYYNAAADDDDEDNDEDDSDDDDVADDDFEDDDVEDDEV
jgi:hypothetical protein